MSKYVQNDEQMWGDYDFVGHEHEARTNQPSMRRAVIRGDYDVSQAKIAKIAPQRRRSFGVDLPGMPDLSPVTKPVVIGNLQYVEPSFARLLIAALGNTSMQATRADGAVVYGTIAPILGGTNWAQDEVDRGGAVLADLAAARTYQFATTPDPAMVAQLARAGGGFAIVAIAPGLEAAAKQMASAPIATPVVAPPAGQVFPGPVPQVTPTIMPPAPQAMSRFANVPTWLKAAVGLGGVVLIGGALYGLAKPARGGATL